MGNEETLWKGRPSQVVNLGPFIILGLFFWLVFPILIIFWKWLVVKNMEYELTSERFIIRHGVFNAKEDEVELYRVKDYRGRRPLMYRPFSLGNILLDTSDQTHPLLMIRGIKDSVDVRTKIRNRVEEVRNLKGVRELSVE